MRRSAVVLLIAWVMAGVALLATDGTLGSVSAATTGSYPYAEHETITECVATPAGSPDVVVRAGLGVAASAASCGYDDSFNLAGGISRLHRYRVAPRAPMRLPASETWGNPNTLARHFRDHGADFAARSADEYANMGSDFFQRGLRDDIPTRIDPKTGVIRMYDPASNTFGAFNASGTTRTFYTPDPARHGFATNWDYWLSQPGYAP